MDIAKIILNGELYKCHNQIMNYEANLYNKYISGQLTNHLEGLYDLSDPEIAKLLVYLANISMPVLTCLDQPLPIDPKIFILTGSGIRELLNTAASHVPTRREYTVHYIENPVADSCILTIGEEKKKFVIDHAIYHSVGHVIYNNQNFIKRIGYYNGKIYVTAMFLVEYHKALWAFNHDMVDPVFKVSYDILDIYVPPPSSVTKNITTLESAIAMAVTDIDKIQALCGSSGSHKTVQNKTILEYAIKQYIEEKHPAVKQQRRKIAFCIASNDLIVVMQQRPAFLYAKMINLHISDPELFSVLIAVSSPQKKILYDLKYDPSFTPSTMDEIDYYIMKHIITIDNEEYFREFLCFNDIFSVGSKKSSVFKKILNDLISYKAKKIITYCLKKHKIDELNIYYLILMLEDFTLLDIAADGFKFDINIAMNFLEDILKKGLLRSFYYLYKEDASVLNMRFAQENTCLHLCENTGQHKELIKLILKLSAATAAPLNQQNALGKTPIITQAEKGYTENIILFLEESPEQQQYDLTLVDHLGETFLHKIAKNGHSELLHKIYKKCMPIANIKNNHSETAVLLAALKGHEDVFYILKGGLNADLSIKDLYGNTVYHYLCLNGICIKSIIINDRNKFGFTPFDYCKIAPEYYNFIK